MEGVLCVGLVCLDIINSCDHYPQEDEDVRASDQKWRKGGNAANTLSVLCQLDSSKHCELLSTLGEGMETEYVINLLLIYCWFVLYSYVLSELDESHIDHTHCRVYPSRRLPTSYVLLNTSNGSRTIVHYR